MHFHSCFLRYGVVLLVLCTRESVLYVPALFGQEGFFAR